MHRSIRHAAAPEFAGIDTWINSTPLTLTQLRGKVVLVDFWAFACGSCIESLPALKSWHRQYAEQGLVVVGVHTPEFPFEEDTNNVKRAVERFGIAYPVAQDNGYATWAAYGNQRWPSRYLIDRHGRVVHTQAGEGGDAQTEAAIEALLAAR
ncbi:redoxin family protein [Caballeronia cordobensis]|uniref:redoxin family protein n=1 Tax=Caballeronia cordobensis TaxID=1353886 RepID=UPI00045F0590|nr:redoxin domain protein [Burkholderia sp. RPE67]